MMHAPADISGGADTSPSRMAGGHKNASIPSGILERLWGSIGHEEDSGILRQCIP